MKSGSQLELPEGPRGKSRSLVCRFWNALFLADVAPLIWKNYRVQNLGFEDIDPIPDANTCRRLLDAALPVLERNGGSVPWTVWTLNRRLLLRGLLWGVLQAFTLTIFRPEAVRFVLREIHSAEPRLHLIVFAVMGPIITEGFCWLHGQETLAGQFWTRLQGMLATLVLHKVQKIDPDADEETEKKASADHKKEKQTQTPTSSSPAVTNKVAEASTLIAVEIFGKANLVALVSGWLPSNVISLIFGCIYLIVLLGPVGALTMLFIVVTILMSARRLLQSRKFERQAVAHASGRLATLREILANIRGVKYACWEGRYFEKLQKLRQQETRAIESWHQFKVLGSNLGRSVPVLASVFALTVYSYWYDNPDAAAPSSSDTYGGPLTVELVFPVLAALQGLRPSIVLIPINLMNVAVLFESMRRVEKYLRLPERSEYRENPVEQPDGTGSEDAPHLLGSVDGLSVSLARKQTTAESDDATAAGAGNALVDVSTSITALDNVSVPRLLAGKLVAISGAVGAGKSVFLHTLLGEQTPSSGRVYFTQEGNANVARVGYCPQRVFVISGTIEENVRMGRMQLTQDQVRIALSRAQLEVAGEERERENMNALAPADHDQENPAAGPKPTTTSSAQELFLTTEIGEGGVTLSGGQQQRLNLARAWAGEPEILVADDPLAAVDHSTGLAIFENLRAYADSADEEGTRRLVLLSMNQEALLERADLLLCFEKGKLRDSVVSAPKLNGDTFGSVAGAAAEVADVRLVTKDADPQHQSVELPEQEVTDADGLSPAASGMKKRRHSIPDFLDVNLQRDISRVTDNTAYSSEQGTDAMLSDVIANRHASRSRESEMTDDQQLAEAKKGGSLQHSQKFLKNEEKAVGTGRSYVSQYFALFGATNFSGLVVLFFGSYGVFATSELALAEWVRRGSTENASATIEASEEVRTFDDTYFNLYFFCAIGFAVFSSFLGLLYFRGAARAGRAMHDLSVVRVLGAPLLYFDESSSGRVFGPLSTDLNGVDIQFSTIAEVWMQFCGLGFTVLALMVFVVPLTLPIIAVVGACYWFLVQIVLWGVRDTKRLCSLALTPVLANIAEAVEGASLSRVMGLEKFFLEKHCRKTDLYLSCWYSSQKITFFSNLLCYLLAGIVASSMVLLAFDQKDEIPRARIGLLVGYCFMLPFIYNLMAQFWFIVSLGLMQVERVFRLQETLQEEPIAEFRRAREMRMLKGGGWKPMARKQGVEDGSAAPPSRKSYMMDTGEEDGEGGEHVGICGKTGAGKSSICAMLFRFVELEQGRIRIGSYEAGALPLYHLRRNLFMVPQKPFLMEGTVRENLDPFGEFSNEEVESAFAQAFGGTEETGRITSETAPKPPAVENESSTTTTGSAEIKPAGTPGPKNSGATTASANQSHITLDTKMSAHGANLSAGEGQLIAFARMLLRRGEAQIVILDEPSSNLDYATDARITELLRTVLRQHTVLLIAHRLDTLSRCDKVLVMENGSVAEFGTPSELLQSGGFFAQNYHDGGNNRGA
eukprot:g67.t1